MRRATECVVVKGGDVGNSEIKTLEALIERHQKTEDSLAVDLNRAIAELELLKTKEKQAQEKVLRTKGALQDHDRESEAELEKGSSIDQITSRNSYRQRLVDQISSAEQAYELATQKKQQADQKKGEIQKKLATAASKRHATEKMLEKALSEKKKRIEEKLEDEAADLRAVRFREEDAC